MKRNRRQPEPRNGFTLVELLLVMAIIAILSTLAVLALRGAQDEAKHGATQARVSQIRALLQQRMEDYEVRKLPIRLTNYTTNRGELRQLKQLILADMVSCEMPRDASHVRAFPSPQLQAAIMDLESQTPPGDDFVAPDGTDLITALQQPQMMPALARRFVTPTDPIPNPPSPANLNAEYLYGVLATTDFDDTPGIEALGASAIADTDNDGYLEVVDNWGQPIEFELLDPIPDPMDPTNVIQTPIPNNPYPSGNLPTRLSDLVIHIESAHDHAHND